MLQNESPSGAARGDVITFTGLDGTWWRVYETEGSAVPGSRGARCLCFDSAWVIRRVWTFPDNWRELSAKDLDALSWQR